jgi:hypothetical protein
MPQVLTIVPDGEPDIEKAVILVTLAGWEPRDASGAMGGPAIEAIEPAPGLGWSRLWLIQKLEEAKFKIVEGG